MALSFKKDKGMPLLLDIGSNSVKWMQVKWGGKAPLVEKIGVTKLPMGSIRDGFITDDKAIIQRLSMILEEHKLKAKSCVTALSGLQTIAKLVKLPPMEEAEVKQALTYQADSYLPYPSDQAIMDIHVLGEVTEGESRQVAALLVASQKEVVYSTVELLEEVGLKVRALEMAPLVMLRSVLETQPKREGKNIIHVHIGASASVLAMVSGEGLRFCRVVPHAGNDLSRALVNTLRLEFADAERTKKRKGAAFIEEAEGKDLFMVKQLKNMMEPMLREILNEIQRSIVYYESKYRRSNIEMLFLSGGTAKLKGIETYLSKQLDIPVETVNPFASFEVNADVSEGYLKAVAPLFAVCTGLALREFETQLSEEKFQPVGVDYSFEYGSSRQVRM